ncbi:class I SAM-dependent methyltransferase [Aquimarina intermedia]|nr:class I SAM-dependent methyltransferase [Aquimarina intermedia]
MQCTLCDGQTVHFCVISSRDYYRCTMCDGVQLATQQRLSPEKEENRYTLHKNDINDTGYQKFVMPLVDAIKKKHSENDIGLDFGCGTGPVIAELLLTAGYDIEKYDPFFAQDYSVFEQTYDFIFCCEVIEHFYSPKQEFSLLHTLLKPEGKLYCKTNLFLPSIDFKNWWYKNDSTHVFFYSKDTIKYIKQAYNFSSVCIEKEFVVFEK